MQKEAAEITQEKIISHEEESTRLYMDDGISTKTEFMGMRQHYISDPVTDLNPCSSEYRVLNNEKKVEINLRIQKLAFIQVIDKTKFLDIYLDIYYDNPKVANLLDSTYQDCRESLSVLIDELKGSMKQQGEIYEVQDPFTGDLLTGNSLKLYLYNAEKYKFRNYPSTGNRRYDRTNSINTYEFNDVKEKCQKFYNSFRDHINPHISIDRFYSNLLNQTKDLQTAYTEILELMQKDILSDTYKVLANTRQSTKSLGRTTNLITRSYFDDSDINTQIQQIPIATKNYISYYRQKGYDLPFQEEEVEKLDPPSAYRALKKCEEAVRVIEETNASAIDQKVRFRLKIFEKTLGENIKLMTELPALESLKKGSETTHKHTTPENLITSYGLNPEIVIQAWSLGSSISNTTNDNKYEFPSVKNVHLEMMKNMEYERPGICKVLYVEFGILNYSRCPIKQWIDQYDQRNDYSHDYGLALFAREDHNGVFIASNDKYEEFKDTLDKANEVNKNKVLFRVIEAATNKELKRKMFHLRTHYQPDISWCIINAHGWAEGFSLSRDKDGYVQTSKINTLHGKLFLSFFKPEAKIILASCSTGTYEGLAHEISTHSQHEVLAADSPTSVSSLKYIEMVPKIQFANARTIIYQHGKMVSI